MTLLTPTTSPTATLDLTKAGQDSMSHTMSNTMPHTTNSSRATTHDRLEVENLTIEYARGAQKVRPVENRSFSAAPGSITLLLGPSGCGKTTILSCLGAMMTPTSGSIRLGGVEVQSLAGSAMKEYRRSHVGIVFQSFNLLPSLTAVENVAIVMTAAGKKRREANARATELLRSLGLGDRLTHKPDDLSGGQQQRVAIARAVALDPKLVLADEPTAHLDHASVDQVLELHRRLADEGRIIVVSTHDDRMLPVATQVIELAPRHTASFTAPGMISLSAGEYLFRQGDRGDLVYSITSGRVAVERVDPDGSNVRLATRMAGEYVGEMAPMFSLPRSASVIAETDVVAEAMTVSQFRERFAAQKQ